VGELNPSLSPQINPRGHNLHVGSEWNKTRYFSKRDNFFYISINCL
jgi:hypothetical protein